MGFLLNGKCVDQWYDTKQTKGKFVRQESKFREWIKADGSTPYTPEKDRYHLYVSLACPWAHRTLIYRNLKGLEDIISVSIVDPIMLENGWEFHESSGSTLDDLYNSRFLYEVYLKSDASYNGRVTVPILWDKKTNSMVNNESSEIIRIFNSEFNELTGNALDFYPEILRNEIDQINEFVYANINNGVYKAGFATTQEAYEEAVENLFQALDRVEDILSKQRYLVGDQITEADWRLFTTLIRFDPVYVGHFKCNIKQIADYQYLSRYVGELYNYSGVKETVNFDHIKRHYYVSHRTINPTGIVSKGPELDYLKN